MKTNQPNIAIPTPTNPCSSININVIAIPKKMITIYIVIPVKNLTHSISSNYPPSSRTIQSRLHCRHCHNRLSSNGTSRKIQKGQTGKSSSATISVMAIYIYITSYMILMAQISKVKRYKLEQDVIELYKRGLRDQVISTELNARNNLQPPLNRQNIQNFIKTVPAEILRAAKEKHDETVYESTRQELKEHIHRLQTELFPRLLNAIESDQDLKKIRILGNLYRDVFKIVTNLEGLAGSEGVMRAEHKDLIQQLKEAREFVKSIHAIVCPNCKTLIRKIAKEKSKGPEVKLKKKKIKS